MLFRTDLAIEAREYAGDTVRGVETDTEQHGRVTVTRMKITTPQAAMQLEKPQGNYITLEVPPFTDDCQDSPERISLVASEISDLLRAACKKNKNDKIGLVLVAGLGNSSITPDNLGPLTASSVLATRHIAGEYARAAGLEMLRPVAVIAPGVLGQTGIETGELLYAIVQRVRPDALIVVDALASRQLDRLGRTIQLSDAGISPGSGVGNARPQINGQTMGIPVISMGVPTVVDAATLAVDLLSCEDERQSKDIKQHVSPRGESMIVTPREIDLLIQRAARLTGMAINCALQPGLTLEDLSALVS